MGCFRTFLDVLRCIAPLISRELQTCLKLSCQFASYKNRQVRTRLKQSCQFASYKTRQVKSQPWLAGVGWLGWAGLSCAGFWDVLGRFRTYWDVLRCIASLFSRQVQTRLKHSCQFASYKTRQIQSRPWLAGVGWLGGLGRLEWAGWAGF